jgi:hypothetical protein
LVAVSTYVVVLVGVTDWDPVNETAPMPGVMETEAASVMVQCSVEDELEVTVMGDA